MLHSDSWNIRSSRMTAIAIGTIMAVVAVLLIHIDSRAEDSWKPNISLKYVLIILNHSTFNRVESNESHGHKLASFTVAYVVFETVRQTSGHFLNSIPYPPSFDIFFKTKKYKFTHQDVALEFQNAEFDIQHFRGKCGRESGTECFKSML